MKISSNIPIYRRLYKIPNTTLKPSNKNPKQKTQPWGTRNLKAHIPTPFSDDY